ncbi:MAG TPA: protein kinase [Gemmatimonadales bacterium]|nr:protein kinase [Gemmatimonadales bacterium]
MTTRTTNCPRCSQPLQAGARFCPSCGSDTSGDQTAIATRKLDSASALLAKGDSGLIEALRHATLGEYEVMGLLGRGGMATVYLAHDIALDRKVAIKVMSPHLLSGEGMAERFKREARTAGSLSHPHIIPIYAVKEAGDLLFFVMKFVEGRPLDGIIREVGAVPFPMAQTIMQQVGSALGYAHRRGIIHRDIKPANIMLDVDGWAMVTDFGIAKVADKEGLTMTGATVGTPSYMSPEQCAATKELTQASDQYSLGIVAYEMLAGRLPFTAETVMAIMYAHFNEPPAPIESNRADCPREIASAVMRMLEKDPAKRWPNVEAAVAAFGNATLAPDDPVRTQMMTLATQGGTSQLLAKFSTPASPTPVGKSQSSKPRKGVGEHAASTTSAGVVGLALAPAQVTVAVGGAVQLTARPKRASGATLVGRVITWATTDHDVATVSDDGLVTALQPGAATITCTCEGASATAAVTVTGHKKSRALAYAGGIAALALLGAGAWVFGPWNKPPQAVAPPPAPPAGPVAPPTEPVVPAVQPGNQPARGQHRTGVAAKVAAAPPPAPQPVTNVTPPPPPPPPPPPTLVTPPPATNPPPAVAENPRPLIDAAIQGYARALESRDVQQVRRVYPGLTPQQAQVWRDFFGMVSDLKVDLAIKQLQITGEVAEAQVEGLSQYTQNRRPQRQPMSFHATLDRTSGTWRIGSIR